MAKRRKSRKKCVCKTPAGKLKRGCSWRGGDNALWGTKGCRR